MNFSIFHFLGSREYTGHRRSTVNLVTAEMTRRAPPRVSRASLFIYSSAWYLLASFPLILSSRTRLNNRKLKFKFSWFFSKFSNFPQNLIFLAFFLNSNINLHFKIWTLSLKIHSHWILHHLIIKNLKITFFLKIDQNTCTRVHARDFHLH